MIQIIALTDSIQYWQNRKYSFKANMLYSINNILAQKMIDQGIAKISIAKKLIKKSKKDKTEINNKMFESNLIENKNNK